jgi:hypothetical protein
MVSEKFMHNLLLRYDDVQKKLSISALDDQPGYTDQTINSKLFSVIELDIAEVQIDKDNTHSELKIGKAILSIVGFYSKESIEDALSKVDSEFHKRAIAGDLEGQYLMAQVCMRKSIESSDESLLEEAEKWLRLSADGGYHKAKKYLEKTWDRVKVGYQNRIRDKKP